MPHPPTRTRNRSPFAGLALVAMLLLALLPTAGRLAGVAGHAAPHVVASAAMGDHAMHGQGMHGHAMPAAHHAMAGHAHPAPAKPASAPGHADCDYCPLLASLAFLALPAALTHAPVDATRALPAPAAPLRSTPRVPGLGARGPPSRA